MGAFKWYLVLLNITDGAVWIFGPAMIITMFFGYEAKSKNKVKKHLTIALAGYELLYVSILILVTAYGKEIGILNGVPILFGVIYWTINNKKVNKIKSFIIAMISCEILVITVILISETGSMIFANLDINRNLKLVLMILAPIFWLFIIYFFSKMSCKKRKEPMSMSLIIVTFIMFVFIDCFMGILGIENDSYLDNLKFLRIVADLNIEGYGMTVGVLSLFIVMIIFVVLMIIKESESIYFKKKNAVNEYYLGVQKEHYESLSNSNREIRKIKHDMKNHLYVISELVSKKDYDELDNYVKELETKFEHVDTSVHVGNEIADAIIAEKQRKANEQGIKVNIDGDMSFFDMSPVDVCTVFANLLDNAIEATEKLPDNKKWIELTLKKHNDFLFVCEKNPCVDSLEIIDNEISSTKKDKGVHGFGLINIKETVEKYDGDVKLSCEKQDDLSVFSIEIVLG